MSTLDELARVNEELRPDIAEWILRVANRGLWDRVIESRKKGMGGVFGGVALQSWCMCGRIMVTMESEGGQITLMGAEESTEESNRLYRDFQMPSNPANPYRIGLHSVEGTTQAAAHMLRVVWEEWPWYSVDKQRERYKDDGDVIMDVMAGMPRDDDE